ncbi:hypothetical protein QJQ45_026307 [Haematococcus lacustris]|nr:hypothetical protein QJQ45_026307 [Haematococcus lacustris]
MPPVMPPACLKDQQALWTRTGVQLLGLGPELEGKVDAQRLLLWGTSYSGGHVLVTAARQNSSHVKGVVSQVPHLSGPIASSKSVQRRGLLPSLRLFLAGCLDAAGSRLGLAPLYVRLAGLRGSVAFMALDPDELKTYEAKHPAVKQGGWQNLGLARLALEAPRYSPVDSLPALKAAGTRVLFLSAVQDSLCPHEVVMQAAGQLGAEVLAYDVDHFSLYVSPVFQQSVSRMLAFMCEATGHTCLLGTEKEQPAPVRSSKWQSAAS